MRLKMKLVNVRLLTGLELPASSLLQQRLDMQYPKKSVWIQISVHLSGPMQLALCVHFSVVLRLYLVMVVEMVIQRSFLTHCLHFTLIGASAGKGGQQGVSSGR